MYTINIDTVMACLIKFTGDHIFTFIDHAVLQLLFLFVQLPL